MIRTFEKDYVTFQKGEFTYAVETNKKKNCEDLPRIARYNTETNVSYFLNIFTEIFLNKLKDIDFKNCKDEELEYIIEYIDENILTHEDLIAIMKSFDERITEGI